MADPILRRVHLAQIDSPRLWLDRPANERQRDQGLAEQTVKLAFALFGEITVLAHELLDYPPLLSGRLRPLLLGSSSFVRVFGWQPSFTETMLYAFRRREDDPQFFKSRFLEPPHLQAGYTVGDLLQDPAFGWLVEEVQALDNAGVQVTKLTEGTKVGHLIDRFSETVGRPEELRGIDRPQGGWWKSRGSAYVAAQGMESGEAREDLKALYDLVTRTEYARLTKAVPFIAWREHSDANRPDIASNWPLFHVSLQENVAGFRLLLDRYDHTDLDGFRKRLTEVEPIEFVQMIEDDATIPRLRDELWVGFGRRDTATCERSANKILERLDDMLTSDAAPTGNEEHVEFTLGSFGIRISGKTVADFMEWTANSMRGLSGIGPSLHGVIAVDLDGGA